MALTKTFLGSAVEDASSTTIAVTVDSTGHTHIVCFVKHEGAADTITGADNKGSGAYTGLTKVDHSNNDLSGRLLWVKIGTPGTSHTITVTFGSSKPYRRLAVWGVNADSGNIDLDVQATAQGTGTSAIDAGSLATTAATVSFMGIGEYATTTYTPGSGWTEDLDNGIHAQSRADASGTLDPACTSVASMDFVACAASFKELAGGAATLAAVLAGSATVAASLTTAITLATQMNATASLVADLLTDLQLASALTGSGAVAGSLTTDIRLAAALQGLGSLAAALTTAIRLASQLTGAGAVSADLQTPSASLAAALQGAGSLASSLTTDIRLATALSASASLAADLTTQIRLAAALVGSSALTGDLQTDLRLAAALSASASLAADLATEIRLASQLLGSGSITADLAIGLLQHLLQEIRVALSVSGQWSRELPVAPEVCRRVESRATITRHPDI